MTVDDSFVTLEERQEDLYCLQKSVEEKLKAVDRIALGVENITIQLKVAAIFQEKLWSVFLSFNLILAPLLLAILFGYFTSEQMLSPTAETTRHIFMTILIFFSIIVGLPLYIYSLLSLEKFFGDVKLDDSTKFETLSESTLWGESDEETEWSTTMAESSKTGFSASKSEKSHDS